MCFDCVSDSLSFGSIKKDFDTLYSIPEGFFEEAKKSRNLLISNKFTPSLDTNIKFVSGDTQKFRIEFEKMRRYSGSFLIDDKDRKRDYNQVCLCGVRRLNSDLDNSPINVVSGVESGKIYYNGLMKCGSVWRCPVCGFKITKYRQNEIYYMSSEWMRRGFKISFVTLTIRHKKMEELRKTLDKLLSEFRLFQCTKSFKKLEKQHEISGFVKTLEITYGFDNGWHPHLHLLVFHNSENTNEFHHEFLKLWCSRKKIKALMTSQRAKDVYDGQGVSEYITKWDMTKEMTQSSFKEAFGNQSFTPFSMLRKLALNDFSCCNEGQILKDILRYKFLEYCKATKGRHFIVVSKKMKAFFRDVSGSEMKSDDEILQDEKVDKILFKVDIDLWDAFVKNKNVLPSYLINAYENGGIDYVLAFFDVIGFKVKYDIYSGVIYPVCEDFANDIPINTAVYVYTGVSWDKRYFKEFTRKGILCSRFEIENENENRFIEYHVKYTFDNPNEVLF